MNEGHLFIVALLKTVESTTKAMPMYTIRAVVNRSFISTENVLTLEEAGQRFGDDVKSLGCLHELWGRGGRQTSRNHLTAVSGVNMSRRPL